MVTIINTTRLLAPDIITGRLSEKKLPEKEKGVALEALEKVQETLRATITGFSKTSNKLIGVQSHLKSVQGTIKIKKELEGLDSVYLDLYKKLKKVVQLVKIPESKFKYLVSVIQEVELIVTDKSAWYLKKLRNIKELVPKEYHSKKFRKSKAFKEICDKLERARVKVKRKLSVLKENRDILAESVVRIENEIQKLNESILGAFRFDSIETLRKKEQKLIKELEKLNENRIPSEHQIKGMKSLQAKASIKAQICDNNGITFVGNPGDHVDSRRVDSRRMSTWEQFKAFILRIISAVKNIFVQKSVFSLTVSP